MLFLSFVVLTVIGVTSADQKCDDKFNACKADYWTPHEKDYLPSERCEAAGEWYKCLTKITGCKDIQTAIIEVVTMQAKVCYNSDPSACNAIRDKCRAQFEDKVDKDPKYSCSYAFAWVSCLTHPDTVFECGPDVPEDVLAIRDDRCYSFLVKDPENDHKEKGDDDVIEGEIEDNDEDLEGNDYIELGDGEDDDFDEDDDEDDDEFEDEDEE